MVNKDIVLFGTGKYFENYMLCCGAEKKPLFAVDNDAQKVGTERCGVAIYAPEKLLTLKKDSFYVIICSIYYREIEKQLNGMGIVDCQNYRPIPIEEKIMVSVTEHAKPYKIGYVPGVYDLFHVGHLNLLRNAKSRCEYLIVGVLTDELVEHFKNKRPIIPFSQRVAIVEAIKYVDRVVPVDFSNTRKLDAWNRYHYDCHFSGNDHGTDWTEDMQQLREVGANMEFLEYTKVTSSTMIKEKSK